MSAQLQQQLGAKERREERQHALGIDCADRLTWKEWEPGKEYTKKILVKNVDRTSQTIQLSLPAHRKIFITPFPEPVTLSSGVSHEISISFRPVELVELHDALTITVEGRGAFQVHLDCLTPYAKLSMPSSYDFDYCAIGATAHAEVELRNSGTAPVEFTWEAPAPFCILPKHAILDRGEIMHLTVLFSPTDACTMVGQAVCRLTGMEEIIATLRISGIGKYPFIAFHEPGPVAAAVLGGAGSNTLLVRMEGKMNGAATTQEVQLTNPSAVTATVRLRRSDVTMSSAFRVLMDGVEEAALNAGEPFEMLRGAVHTVRLHYSPGTPGVLHSTVLQFDCLEGNALQLEVTAATVGPRVTTSVSNFDFGAVDLEHLPSAKQRTRYLTLRNTSSIDAAFTWLDTVPGAAFVVSPHCGVVAAHSTLQVAVTFQPTHPILFHRYLRLVVEGAEEVVGLDVFGGAYNAKIRPPALSLADVEAARLRAERGLGLLTPAELDVVARAAAAAEDADGGDGDNAFSAQEPSRAALSPKGGHSSLTPGTLETWRRIEEDARGSGVVMRGAKHKNRAPLSSLEHVGGQVAIDTPFGIDAQQLYTFVGKSSGDGRGLVVTVMNTSEEPAVATWCVPGPSCPFSVVPPQQAVPPRGSAVFQLTSSSGGAGAVDNSGSSDSLAALCTLECYVNFESMSVFYLAPDTCVVPPRCFTVMCTSSSGSPTGATKPAVAAAAAVASQVRVMPQVCMSACRLGGSSYQVVALHNRSGAAARYEVSALLLKQVSAVELPKEITLLDPPASAQEADVDSSAFSIFPSAGVVPPKGRQLIVVKFRPSEAARYEAAATLTWNAKGRGGTTTTTTAGDVTTVALFGEVCLPQLQWRDACDTPAADIVFPPSCVSGEVQQQAWVHNPTSLPVTFRFDTSAGLLGVLRMEPEWAVVPGFARLPVSLFFSPQQPRVFSGYLQLHLEDGAAESTSGQLYRQQLPVLGQGAYADVEVEPRRIDVGEAPDTREQQAALTLYNSGPCEVQYEVRTLRIDRNGGSADSAVVPRLHNSCGVLPARTHTTVLAAAQPTPGLTEFILYAVISGLSTDLSEVADADSVAEAQRHPHCRWSLRAAHPAVQIVNVSFPGVARPLAWQQLNLNAVNAQLSAVGEAAGLRDGDAFSFQHYVSGLAPITMDLGVAHEATAPVSLILSLQNTGDCPAPFSIMYPTQHDANTEHWCLENSELADLQYIVDRGIIAVTPSHGSINVGETVQLHIAYTHDEVGVHRLPVLVRVGAGERRVAVVLEGRTLPPSVQVLNFHHEKVYDLLPVALGDMEPPLQYITVSNPSDEPVEYSVDVAALEAHAQENYGFPVFQCSDPEGTVGPHQTASIGFYFRPLEAKEYEITVLVQTAQGEGYYVDLVGTGYHPREATRTSIMRWVDNALLRVPPVPSLIPHTNLVRLVDDVCTLGAVPYYTLCRRMCTLQLAAEATTAMRYVWQSEHPRHGDAQLAIHPYEGTLQPGERQTVQITFYAGSTSQVMEHLLSCVVTPNTSANTSHSGTRAVSPSGRLGERGRTSQQQQPPAVATVLPQSESVGLLVQARVMPRDDFESLYGPERLKATFMPALYSTHVDPLSYIAAPRSIAAGATVPATSHSKDETRFVRALLDELLRDVVASPGVQDSFTAMCPPRTVSYATLRALHSSPGDAAGAQHSTANDGADAAAKAKADDFTAAVVTEGVLEELLRGIIGESIAAA